MSRIEIIGHGPSSVTLRLDCSAGFYVRSLAHDLGQALGTGAHLASLRRTRSGDCTLAEARPLDALECDPEAARSAVLPLERMLPDMSAVLLSSEGARRAAHGRNLGSDDLAAESPGGARFCRLLDPAGRLIGVAEPDASGLLHPFVVLV